jgi:hypothetical protein
MRQINEDIRKEVDLQIIYVLKNRMTRAGQMVEVNQNFWVCKQRSAAQEVWGLIYEHRLHPGPALRQITIDLMQSEYDKEYKT